MKQIFLVFARNTVFANIVLVLIIVAGIMAATAMQRELFPDFSMDEIAVEVSYPGASPREVEEGVILKIEDALAGMEGIAQYTTRCEESRGSAGITVKHGYDTASLLNRIRSRIGAISTFPGGVENPLITEVMHRTEVMKLFLSADVPEQHLKEVGRLIRDDLRQLDGVSQIELVGVRPYEIQVEIPEARLRAFGLTLEAVAERISQSSLNASGGTIRTGVRDIRIRVPALKVSGRDLVGVAVLTRQDGSILTLGHLADIRDGFSDDTMEMTVDGRPAVGLEIYKTRKEDALEISRAVTRYIREKNPGLPEDVRIGILYDLTEDLRSRIDLMVKNGVLGLCLVLLMLWLFLDFRLGFWAGLGIPVSILGALVVVWAMGGTINMLSLFGLITVLGIVVDDAIVVGEAVFHHYQKGLAPLDASLAGITEVGMPVAAAILTMVLAFLPLAFIGDIIGKFLSILPGVVIPCLIVSLMECMFLLPAHLAHGLKGNPVRKRRLQGTGIHQRTRRGLDRFARRVYLPFLRKALAHRYVSICAAICLSCLCTGLVLGGMVRFEVLPETGSALVSASVKLPGGTSASLTLLERLMTASPGVVSRKELENALWGDMPPGSDSLRSHMYLLRKKIDKPFDLDLIHTVHGVGYKLAAAHDLPT